MKVNVLQDPNLIEAMDYYELHLMSYPEVVPNIGFTVLQSEINLEDANTRINNGTFDMSKTATGDKIGLLTFRREIDTDPKKNPDQNKYFSLTLLNKNEFKNIPRLTRSKFYRLGTAVKVESFTHDNQGRPFEYDEAPSFLKLHAGLARCTLLSGVAIEKITDMAEHRKKLEAEIKHAPAIDRKMRERLTTALMHTVLG